MVEASAYVGWLRVGVGPWRSVCEGASRDDTIFELMRHAQTVAGSHKDLVVLAAGEHPLGPVAVVHRPLCALVALV